MAVGILALLAHKLTADPSNWKLGLGVGAMIGASAMMACMTFTLQEAKQRGIHLSN